MDTARPDVLLCHCGVDKPWVKELGARLEAESIDDTVDARRIRVFLDEWDIEKGENFVSRLSAELASGAFVAVIMSPEFFTSEWTRFEWTDVVARDPVNQTGRLLPLRVRDVSLDGQRRLSLPAPFNALNYFDFRTESRFEPVFQDLLRRIRNQPLPRGDALPPRYSTGLMAGPHRGTAIEEPDSIEEQLISNLAPLTSDPPPLFMATTSLTALSELPVDAAFKAISARLWDGKLITFVDLEDPECILNSKIDPYTIRRVEFSECTRDPDLTTQWLALANKVLAQSLRNKGIAQDDKGRFYFLPQSDGGDRVISVAGTSRDVACKKSHHTSGQSFWVHYAADLRFRLIASTPFLRVLPSYSFTHDGMEALDRKIAGRFRVMWGGKQDSATVLRQVLFWLRFLSENHEEWTIDTGGTPIRVGVMPATAVTQIGISNDHIRIKALVEEAAKDELRKIADSAELEISEDENPEDSPEVEAEGSEM